MKIKPCSEYTPSLLITANLFTPIVHPIPHTLSLNIMIPLSTPHTRAVESDRLNMSPESSLRTRPPH